MRVDAVDFHLGQGVGNIFNNGPPKLIATLLLFFIILLNVLELIVHYLNVEFLLKLKTNNIGKG